FGSILALERRARTVAATLRWRRDLALERLADERLPLVFLFGSQQAEYFFVTGLARFLDFLAGFGSIAPAAAPACRLKRGAQLLLLGALNGEDRVLLFLAQAQGGCHFVVADGGGPTLLQRDLLQPLELVGVENLGHQFVVGLGTL